MSAIALEATVSQVIDEAMQYHYSGQNDSALQYVARWMASRGTPFDDERLVLRQFRQMISGQGSEDIRHWLRHFIVRHTH